MRRKLYVLFRYISIFVSSIIVCVSVIYAQAIIPNLPGLDSGYKPTYISNEWVIISTLFLSLFLMVLYLYRKKQIVTIKIIKPPFGDDCPETVNNSWVGLVIPKAKKLMEPKFSESSDLKITYNNIMMPSMNVLGYQVKRSKALALLKSKDTESSAWMQGHLVYTNNDKQKKIKYIIFDKSVVEEIIN